MTDHDRSLDPFDEILDALDDANPEDPSDAPASLTPIDDAFAADAAIQDAFERHVSLFAQENGIWHGMPCAFGCRHAEVLVSRADGLVNVDIDTGVRIPSHRRAEANKLIMLENGTFRLSGFEPVGDARDGAVAFAFSLDERLVAGNLPTGSAMPDPERSADNPLGSSTLLTDGPVEEDGLSMCLALALSTVRGFIPKFNAIAYGGRTALEVAAE